MPTTCSLLGFKIGLGSRSLVSKRTVSWTGTFSLRDREEKGNERTTKNGAMAGSNFLKTSLASTRNLLATTAQSSSCRTDLMNEKLLDVTVVPP